MADAVRYKGAVKWFNPSKGFGFVTPESGGEELFVHQSSINAEGFRSLGEGEIVEFNIETGPDGRSKAVNVTGPDGAPPQGAPKRMNNPRRGMAPSMMLPGGMGGRGGYYDPNAAYGYAAPGYYMAPGYYFPQGGRSVFMGGRGGRGGRGGFVNSMAQAGSQGGAPAGQAASGLQVVVHNLPWTTTWQQLKDSFRDWKVDRADIVYDNWGRSRGFGVVRFGSKEDAEAACAKLNNTQVEGRTISVRIDRFA